jgi:hypothetical protein
VSASVVPESNRFKPLSPRVHFGEMQRIPEGAFDEAKRLLAEARDIMGAGAEQLRAWLATPQGRRFRQLFARVLLVGSPLIFRLRIFRATPLGRLIEFAGGAAVLVKLAEIIRDWEPDTFPRVVDTSGTRRPG